MANLTLTNNAIASGIYEGAPTDLANTQAAVVILVDDITMTLTAQKTRWADRLPNQYTATITVAPDGSPLELGENDVITFATDQFNAAVSIDPASVNVTGNTATNIAVTGNILRLNLTEVISETTPTVITFNVNKV